VTAGVCATDKSHCVAVHFGDSPAPDNFCHRWEQHLLAAGAEVRRVDLLAPAGLAQLEGCAAVMWHWYHTARDKRAALMILPAIDSVLGIPVFPNHASRWHFDEKLAQYYLFKAIAAPAVNTWVFWDLVSALDFLASARYPLVLKLSAGAGSSGVHLLEDERQAQRLAKRLFHEGVMADELPIRRKRALGLAQLGKLGNHLYWSVRYLLTNRRPPPSGKCVLQRGYLYLQEYLPDNDRDIRITVIGERAFGYVRKNRVDDFRASGSGDFDVDPSNIPMEAVKIALGISSHLGFQSMAYDFLRDRDGQLRVNEISYGYVSWMVERCPGYWDSELKWHSGSRWPEDVQVEDFLALLIAEGRA